MTNNKLHGKFSYLSAFSPNAGKYGPEKTPYLDTFHAVPIELNFSNMCENIV